MNLNLTYLKYFYDTVLLGSITASARKNFVTQSAISQGIMKLEQYFKKNLLTHRRNTLKLTAEGQTLFASSQRLFRYVEDIHQTLNQEENTFSGKLELACYYSVAVSLLPQALAKFQQLAPQVKLNFFTGRHELVIDALKKGQAELGILIENQEVAQFDYEIIHSGQFAVYESVNRPKNEPVEKCLFTDPSPEIFSLLNSYKKYYKKELLTHMEVKSWEVLVNLILSNVGVGLIPDYLVTVPYRQPLLRKSKLRYDPIPYNLCAVFPKGEQLSKNAELFLKCITSKHKENLGI